MYLKLVVLTPLLIVRDKSLKVGVQNLEFAQEVVRNDACSYVEPTLRVMSNQVLR